LMCFIIPPINEILESLLCDGLALSPLVKVCVSNYFHRIQVRLTKLATRDPYEE